MGILDHAANAVNGVASAAEGGLSDWYNKSFLPSIFGGNEFTSPTTGNWKYPLTMEETQHTSRLAFNATDAFQGNDGGDQRAKVFGKYGQLKYKTIGTVFLYMPELEVAYSQNFTDDGRGLLWQLNNAVQQNGGYDKIAGSGGIAAVQSMLGNIANNTGLVKDFADAVKNQHNSANFTGTQLRRQKFVFDLRPRDINELKQIAGLLQFFKANSATTLHNGDYMRIPSRWVIEELPSPSAKRIIPPFRFGPAFLTNVHIDYTPDGSWKKFGTGDPIAMTLTLEFMEMTIITREDIANHKL